MIDKTLNLVISFNPGEETSQLALYSLTGQVLKDINKIGVHSVRRAQGGEITQGIKGFPVDITTLIVSLGSAGVLAAVINLLKDWILRAEGRKVRLKIEIDGKSIEFEYSPSAVSEDDLTAFTERIMKLLDKPRIDLP